MQILDYFLESRLFFYLSVRDHTQILCEKVGFKLFKTISIKLGEQVTRTYKVPLLGKIKSLMDEREQEQIP